MIGNQLSPLRRDGRDWLLPAYLAATCVSVYYLPSVGSRLAFPPPPHGEPQLNLDRILNELKLVTRQAGHFEFNWISGRQIV